jgi:putative membrane protein insertion efficiency factor
MGHRDSPAQLGGHGGFFSADEGIAAADSSRTHALNPAGEKRGLAARGKSAAAWTLLLLVRFYITFLSPFFGGACRFHPSCSNYAAEAITRHGAARGLSLALGRLLRCNPFIKGGFDPVPEVLPCEPFAPAPRAQGKPQ